VPVAYNVGFIILIVVTLPLLVTACSASQEAEQSERVSEPEPTVEQTPQQFAQRISEHAENAKSLSDQPKDCQLEQVVADRGEEGLRQLTKQWVQESMRPGEPDASLVEAMEDIQIAQSLPEFLAERGYACYV
jgi:hypothetical protein